MKDGRQIQVGPIGSGHWGAGPSGWSQTNSRIGQDVRIRLAGGGILAAILAFLWWDLLFLPLGASHDGRINGRFGLVVQNFMEKGLAGSDFLADISPFADQPYTHHPPLLNVLQTLIGSVFGLGEWQLHLAGYIGGLATVAAVLWLSHELRLGAWASVLSSSLVVFTPMFWIYGRLGLGVALPVSVLALWYRMERRRPVQPGGRTPVGLMVAGALAAFASWLGAVLVLLVSGWGSLDLRLRRRAMLVGMAGLGSILLTFLWVLQAGTVGELVDHISGRLDAPGLGDIITQYRWFYGTLFPWWVRWTILPALVVALWSSRTRAPAVWFLAALGIWSLAAPQAFYVHDYWTYPLIVPIILGMSVILAWVAGLWRQYVARRIRRRTGRRVAGWVPTLALVVLLLVYAAGNWGDLRQAYFDAPSEAGYLLKSVEPPQSQTAVWMVPGVDSVSRWASFYWDLPVKDVPTGGTNLQSQIGEEELVMVCLSRVVGQKEPPHQSGRYGLVPFADLLDLQVQPTDQRCG